MQASGVSPQEVAAGKKFKEKAAKTLEDLRIKLERAGSSLLNFQRNTYRREVISEIADEAARGSIYAPPTDDSYHFADREHKKLDVELEEECKREYKARAPFIAEHEKLKKKFVQWFVDGREQYELPNDEIARFKEEGKKGGLSYWQLLTPWENRDEEEERALRNAQGTIEKITSARKKRAETQQAKLGKGVEYY